MKMWKFPALKAPQQNLTRKSFLLEIYLIILSQIALFSFYVFTEKTEIRWDKGKLIMVIIPYNNSRSFNLWNNSFHCFGISQVFLKKFYWIRVFKIFEIFKQWTKIAYTFNLKGLNHINFSFARISYLMENDTALYTPVSKVRKPAIIKRRHIGLDKYSKMS